MNSLEQTESSSPGWLQGPADLLRSAAHVLQDDVDGVQQAVSHIRGTTSPKLDLIEAPKEQSMWTAAGSLLGHVAEFALVNKAVGSIARSFYAAGAANTMPGLTMGVAGGFTDVLKPVDDTNGSFGMSKLREAATGFGTFAVMGRTSQFLSDAGILGRLGHRTLADSILANTVSGTAAGTVNVGINAAFTGEFHGWQDVQTVGQFAAFGAVFGAIDYKLGRADFKLSNPDNAGPKLPSTEDLVTQHFDPTRSVGDPFLTFLADTKPQLRPPNYAEWRAQNPDGHLNLNAWTPEGRLQVVQELRRLADSSLATDANLDAFIARYKQFDQNTLADYQQYRSNENQTYERQTEAMKNVVDTAKRLAPDADVLDMIKGKDPRGSSAEMRDALKLAWQSSDEVSKLFAPETEGAAEKPIEGELARAVNSVASEMHVPQLESRLVDSPNLGNLASYWQDNLTTNRAQFSVPLSARTVSGQIHEFRHHLQGSFGVPYFLRQASIGFSRSGFQKYMSEPIERAAFIHEQKASLDQPGGARSVMQDISLPGSPLRQALWGKTFERPVQPQSYQAPTKSLVPNSSIPEPFRKLMDRATTDTSPEFDAEAQAQLKSLLQAQEDQYRSLFRSRNAAFYLGSRAEIPAQATGILAEIRARYAGFGDDPPMSPGYQMSPIPFEISRAINSAFFASKMLMPAPPSGAA